MKKVSTYLKKASKYTFGFEKEFGERNKGALEMEGLFHKYDISVEDFIKSNRYGEKYIDSLKNVSVLKPKDHSILRNLEDALIKLSENEQDEWVKIFIDNEPRYLKKIDSTHLYSSNQPKESIAIHVAELRHNPKLYNDVEQWLHGRLKIENKKY
jgi:hypothetical protein